MQLITHCYNGRKPSRYYMDDRRVSRDAYENAILINRIGHGQHCCFQTKLLNDRPGCKHIVHMSMLTSGANA